jgi:hypothetical protein
MISKEANDYLIKKKKGKRFPNVVIYRDVSGVILGYTTKPLKFIPRVKMMYDEPTNDMFTLVDTTSNGISIWVERALLAWTAKFRSITIGLDRRVFRKLKLDLEPEVPGA